MQNYFKRYEKKYLLDIIQYELLMHFVYGSLVQDERSGYMISNLYYDTDNYDLIRASIEKPVYKEKLRLRTYDAPGVSTPAFIELKKKVDGIVYKRRFKSDMIEGLAFLSGGICPVVKPREQNTVNEILHFLEKNDVSPKALITYSRDAYHGTSDKDFRMTFDSGITYVSMDSGISCNETAKPVLEPNKIIMEIKTTTSVPIWLSKIMSELEIFPVSFSKYGMAYKTYVANQMFMTKDDFYLMNNASGGKKEVEFSA